MLCRVVHRRTAATAIRPWKGPLPKVRLPNLTVFDLIRPDSWNLVKRRKNARRKSSRSASEVTAASSPAVTVIQIRDARQECLNLLLGRAKPQSVRPVGIIGPRSSGYEAQSDLVPIDTEGRGACTYRSSSPTPSPRPRVLLRRTPHLRTAGPGRACRIPPLGVMAGSGGTPPPGKRPPTPSGAGRASGAPPPGQGNGRGALPVPESGAGRGGVPLPKAAAGRGSAGPDAAHCAGGAPVGRPLAPALPSGGRGGPGSDPRPMAPGGAAVAAVARGAAPPRPPVPSGPTPRPAPPPHVLARPSSSSQSNGTVAAPRGQWEDDDYDAYGAGQHRGSSSTGGGRGYAWQSDGSVERPFLGPSGGFVEGPSDPGHRQRGGYRGHRGGQGGRGGRYRPRPPPPPVVVEQMTDNGVAEEPVLTGHAMEVLTALATV
ncbi:translation initiation factor IF-2 isoform X1 [Triticum aestivum]|uniref:translation initiation factor IF-2 isoform X1 n=1 Tax=Triticum aestivum TaxID=4565 RepID=UPI001D019BEE|nr:translation initiation factor IF-2-like isoform X1 [Triticum aestivum]